MIHNRIKKNCLCLMGAAKRHKSLEQWFTHALVYTFEDIAYGRVRVCLSSDRHAICFKISKLEDSFEIKIERV